jgi:hypothetical protein
LTVDVHFKSFLDLLQKPIAAGQLPGGASVPTFLVKYSDGSQARISKDMYHRSQRETVEQAQWDITDTLHDLDAQEDVLREQREALRLKRDALRRLIANCPD